MQERFHVIRGGRERHIQIGPVKVTPASRIRPPFEVQVEVRGEDTWRILSPDIHIEEPPEHPIRVMTGLIEDKPTPPGSVLRQGRRWLAVVYDLDREPICQEAWISLALDNLLAMAAREGTQALRLPLLGSEHGDLPWQRSLELICQALARAEAGPERIWLLVGRERMDECWALMEDYAARGRPT